MLFVSPVFFPRVVLTRGIDRGRSQFFLPIGPHRSNPIHFASDTWFGCLPDGIQAPYHAHAPSLSSTSILTDGVFRFVSLCSICRQWLKLVAVLPPAHSFARWGTELASSGFSIARAQHVVPALALHLASEEALHLASEEAHRSTTELPRTWWLVISHLRRPHRTMDRYCADPVMLCP
jgi:hypothetical protein